MIFLLLFFNTLPLVISLLVLNILLALNLEDNHLSIVTELGPIFLELNLLIMSIS